MANVSDIREHLAQLLSKQMSLDAFEEWFAPYSWNIHKHGDEKAQEFAYSIEHILSRFDEDSNELRQQLTQLSGAFSFGNNEFVQAPPASVAGSNATDLIHAAA